MYLNSYVVCYKPCNHNLNTCNVYCCATDGAPKLITGSSVAVIDGPPRSTMAAIGSPPLPQIVLQDNLSKLLACTMHNAMDGLLLDPRYELYKSLQYS